MLKKTQDEITKNWENCKPLVSIRVTTFNQEKYITDCLDGILTQETNFPFEAIVHDDASKDSTAKIIKKYEELFPKIIKPIYETENLWSKQNGSFTRIINAHLTSKYVAMCEGDDYWIDPKKLQIQIDYLESHPECSMIFHDAEIRNEPGVTSVDSVFPNLENRNYSATELFCKWTAPTASLVYKRSVLDFPVSEKDRQKILNGDIFLVERAAHMGVVHCINKKMSVYRRQPSGVTWDISRKKQRILEYPDHTSALKHAFPLIDKNEINSVMWTQLKRATKNSSGLKKVQFILRAFSLSPKKFIKSVLRKIKSRF